MKRIFAILPLVALLALAGCTGFEHTSDIALGDDITNASTGEAVTIAGTIVDLSGTYSTDFAGFTIGFELDTPETSALEATDVIQSGPIFIFTPDVAGDYYFYAWVYLDRDPTNIGVDVIKIVASDS